MYSIVLALTLQTTGELPRQVVAPLPGNGCTGGARLLPPTAPNMVQAAKPVAAQDAVLRWNEVVLQAIRSERTPPPAASRHLAIVHAAIWDAVNAGQPTHASYYVQVPANPQLVPEAAVAGAAHSVLVALYPRQEATFDTALEAALSGLTDNEATYASFRQGLQVAKQLLAWRGRDGSSATASVSYSPSRAPGHWLPTPPAFRPALLPHWPTVACFCMRASSQFRPPGPPALASEAYFASYYEVKLLGRDKSSVRTADQTEIAHFWADDAGTATPPGHWNQLAQTVARDRGLPLLETARLFALLNLALADAAILSWDCKYKFDVWRPVHAIQATDPDAPLNIRGDPNWLPLLTTPPFPSYTSGHSTFSGAAAAVLANFFGTDSVRFTVGADGLPGRTRSFPSFSAAAAEAGRSRIYGGIHWEFDNADGLATGKALGEYVSRSFLVPRVRLGSPLAATQPER